MSYTSQDRLPMIPRRRRLRAAGVIRITPSFLDKVEKVYAIIVVFVFSDAFAQMVFGDFSQPGVSKTQWYLTTGTLYTIGACFLLVAVFCRRIRVRVPIALLLLLVLAGFSALWSADPMWVLFRLPALLGTYIFGIYLAVRFPPRELISILWWVFTIMAIASFVFIFVLPQIGITVGVVNAEGWPMWRGVFPQKNGLGHYMLLSVITYTLVHFDRAGLGSKYRLFNLAMLFLAAFLLVISDSITSQLLALIGAAILIYVAFIRRTGLVFVPLLLLGVWIAAMIAWVVVSDPGAYTGMVGRDATLSGRTHVWQLAILLVEKKPLLGYGYGTDVLERFVSWIHVHNGFIWMAMQFGLVGLTLLMVFLVQTGWRCYAAAKGSSGSLALWPLGVFVVLVMRNFSEVSFLGSNSLAWCLLIYFSSNETLARWGGSEDSTP